ncbi:uncharacterized protein VTP21DRAFT_1919 [Calcarisporiella thermophila]|uniref:uncharacterized protein n=1 Tax=Calcarisporiella thermophila TaxID=911321 RepID=UPI0037430DAA
MTVEDTKRETLCDAELRPLPSDSSQSTRAGAEENGKDQLCDPNHADQLDSTAEARLSGMHPADRPDLDADADTPATPTPITALADDTTSQPDDSASGVQEDIFAPSAVRGNVNDEGGAGIAALHRETPLLYSVPLSKKAGCNVWLKLENLQPSGSFKIRGIGHLCMNAYKKYGPGTHFINSSGGNAGLATAYAARQLGCAATIVVPLSTSQMMIQKIEQEGAKVIPHGEVWDEADQKAREMVQEDACGVYVPPFDHPDIWAGNATMMEEVKEQLGMVPDAVVCTVGGGGLMNGVILGMREVGWKNVPVVAVETHGANSFQASVLAKRLVTLDKIHSICTTLGAKTVSAKSLELSRIHPVVPFAVNDAMAADASRLFADDHLMLVESSCGAGLSLFYSGVVKDAFPGWSERANVVCVVCGGNIVNLDILQEYRKKYSNPHVIVRSGKGMFLKMCSSPIEKSEGEGEKVN